MSRFIRRALLLFVLLAPGMSRAEPALRLTGGKPPAQARRIVSINPCLDALLVRLADPEQIAAISHYSHQPASAVVSPKEAARFPSTSGSAEEVLMMRPDLVVGSSHVALPTVNALTRLGIPLARFSTPSSVAESQTQITELAQLLRQPSRGLALNRAIDKALRDARPSDDRKFSAVIVTRGSLIPGANTIANELLEHTGFVNQAPKYGPRPWDVVSLENLLGRPPDVLFVGGAGPQAPNRILAHPVLAKVSGRMPVVDYPSRLVHCAGPGLIEAASRLSSAHRKQSKSGAPD